MKHHYRDIRDFIDQEPLWFDENGAPRYREFSPRDTADIYADEAVLLLIACQNCGQRFKVAMSWRDVQVLLTKGLSSIKVRILENTIHYGDPPNVGCCPAGPTMNSEPIQVLQYWECRNPTKEWARNQEFEGILDCDWC